MPLVKIADMILYNILRAKILSKTKLYGIKPKLIKNKKSSITLLIIIEMLYLREY